MDESGLVSQVSPCPYCGHIGYHMWAGTGGCPGAVPERERDATAAVYLPKMENPFEAEIKRHKDLLTRAADALVFEIMSRHSQLEIRDHSELIAELRKAAQRSVTG